MNRLAPPSRLVGLVVGAALVAGAWWHVLGAGDEIVEVAVVEDGVPVTLLLPRSEQPMPGVVLVHGFAGSGRLMRSFGLALAGGGYAVALPDLTGHGANSRRLGTEPDPDRLVIDVTAALDALAARGEVDADRLALLGHSMGSGAAMATGIRHAPRVRAVVAVSPTDAEVTDESPGDLLLLAGAREPRFVANAEDLLARAGGARGQPGDGGARALEVVPRVEHVGILFSPSAHRISAAWLDAALDHGPSRPPTVLLIGWWFAHLAGAMIVWRVLVAPTTRRDESGEGVPALRALIGLLGGGAVATAVVAVAAPILPLTDLVGMHVAPGVAVWLALAGTAWLVAGAHPGRPTAADLAAAGVALVVLAIGFGVVAHQVWLPWLIGVERLAPAIAIALLASPWTLAFAATLHHPRRWSGLAWWAVVSAGVALGLGAAALVVPGLGFLLLVLPVLPLLLGITQLVWAPLARPWAAGLATAAFLGWTLAAFFPLA